VSLCDSDKGCDLNSIECQLLFEDVAYVVKMTCTERMRMVHVMVQHCNFIYSLTNFVLKALFYLIKPDEANVKCITCIETKQ